MPCTRKHTCNIPAPEKDSPCPKELAFYWTAHQEITNLIGKHVIHQHNKDPQGVDDDTSHSAIKLYVVSIKNKNIKMKEEFCYKQSLALWTCTQVSLQFKFFTYFGPIFCLNLLEQFAEVSWTICTTEARFTYKCFTACCVKKSPKYLWEYILMTNNYDNPITLMWVFMSQHWFAKIRPIKICTTCHSYLIQHQHASKM